LGWYPCRQLELHFSEENIRYEALGKYNTFVSYQTTCVIGRQPAECYKPAHNKRICDSGLPVCKIFHNAKFIAEVIHCQVRYKDKSSESKLHKQRLLPKALSQSGSKHW
jgi:hypothetical protein